MLVFGQHGLTPERRVCNAPTAPRFDLHPWSSEQPGRTTKATHEQIQTPYAHHRLYVLRNRGALEAHVAFDLSRKAAPGHPA
jgi:hypothetical protein